MSKKKKESNTSLVIKTSKKSKMFLIPEGIYSAKLTELKIDSEGKYGDQIIWDFSIIKGKKKGKNIRMWSPTEANPKNKTGKAIKAIGNKKKLGDGKFDLEKLIGRKCKLIIEDYTKNSGDKGSKVASVLPYDLEED